MARGEIVPPFADTPVAITNTTNGTVGGIGQTLVGILVATSTSGTLTISTAKLGTIVTNLVLIAGSWIWIPLKVVAGDQVSMVGGGTFTGSAFFQNP